MKIMDSQLLTTGDVAKLCGVTPDAVLKWIKAGKLAAQRTPGGHYRISRQTCQDSGLIQTAAIAVHSSDAADSLELPVPARCWEYFGDNGRPKESCRDCVVYVSRAENCYRLAAFGDEIGHRLNYCATDCGDCAFYRALRGLATTVLVVTRDDALTRRLSKGIDVQLVSLHFVRSGYDCSSAIGSYRPAVIVLDSDLPEVLEGHLVESVTQDIPGAVVFIACRDGDEAAVNSLNVPAIPAPFTAAQLERLSVGVTRSPDRAPLELA